MLNSIVAYNETDSTYTSNLPIQSVSNTDGSIYLEGPKYVYQCKWSDKHKEWCIVDKREK